MPDPNESAVQAELPEWRIELSRRLQEIKSKRENGEVQLGSAAATGRSETAEMPQPPADGPEPEPPRPPIYRKPRRTPRVVDPDLPRAIPPVPEPLEFTSLPKVPVDPEPKIAQELPSSQPAGEILVRPPAQPADTGRTQSTEDLIDSVMAKRAAAEQLSAPAPAPELRRDPVPAAATEPRPERIQACVSGSAVDLKSDRPAAPTRELKTERKPDRPMMPAPESKPEAKPERKAGPKPMSKAAPKPEPMPVIERHPSPVVERDLGINLTLLEEPHDSKLILLSRTLAGLVDLILVVLCAGIMIVTVDILEGIDTLDAVSMIHYGLLLLVLYFVYSVFFLGTAGQTIGMMLTDLRLTSESITRPDINLILVRCCAFLPCLVFGGLGLIWGCFDRQARCLHDLLSRTRVIRTMVE